MPEPPELFQVRTSYYNVLSQLDIPLWYACIAGDSSHVCVGLIVICTIQRRENGSHTICLVQPLDDSGLNGDIIIVLEVSETVYLID